MSEPSPQNISPPLPASPVQSLAAWTWASAAIVLLLAACLTLSPRLLLFISEPASSDPRVNLTPLESFLALQFGVWLLGIALALIFNVPYPPQPVPLAQQATQPYQPLLGPLAFVANISAFLAWNTKSIGPLASIVFIGSLVIGLWGLWAILFAQSSFVSKTTGADKHTSTFIFGNKAAASSIKKRWKQQTKP